MTDTLVIAPGHLIRLSRMPRLATSALVMPAMFRCIFSGARRAGRNPVVS